METGIELIAEERYEQILKHGRSIENDVVENCNGELVQGALVLAGGYHLDNMPKKWDVKICEKMRNKAYKERLIIAGALIAAEIDRLNYTPPTK